MSSIITNAICHWCTGRDGVSRRRSPKKYSSMTRFDTRPMPIPPSSVTIGSAPSSRNCPTSTVAACPAICAQRRRASHWMLTQLASGIERTGTSGPYPTRAAKISSLRLRSASRAELLLALTDDDLVVVLGRRNPAGLGDLQLAIDQLLERARIHRAGHVVPVDEEARRRAHAVLAQLVRVVVHHRLALGAVHVGLELGGIEPDARHPAHHVLLGHLRLV